MPLLDLRLAPSDSEACSPLPRSWDVRWDDLGLLLRCRFRDFRFRRERRLFDMVDSHHTGYVTLDELIRFRDNNQGRFLDPQVNRIVEMRSGGNTDVSKSLLALYHFDVALDGHFTFEEFLLLHAYLQDVEHDDDEAVVCRFIPKNWLRASYWRRRLRALSHRVFKRGHHHHHHKKEVNGTEGPSEGHMLLESRKQKRLEEGEERVLHRRINDHGELHEIECDDRDVSLNLNHETSDHDDIPTPAGSGSDSATKPQTLWRESSVSSQPVAGSRSSDSRSSKSSEDSEGEEEEEDIEFLAAKEEKKKTRRALLVQSLKSNKGRKRFIDWLYRVADTTESDNITMNELVTFLKAIHADGINPEVFADPSEDYGDDDSVPCSPERRISTTSAPQSPASAAFGTLEGVAAALHGSPGRYQRLDKTHPQYIDEVGRRIMTRYNESHSGTLSREEFMQLATMVEREYELSDNNFSGADRVGPYRFIRTLGKGAEGVVKLAINADDESLGKRAVKIIKRGNIASLSKVDREVEAMVLLDHPTVVACLEVLETESNICLVVEYCAGGHIGDYISPTRPMTESAARYYFSQLIDGLSYCHGHCVCHRDLRIENLMLDNKGDLKITDFGHAGIFQAGWDVFQTMMVGSVSHLAPEQVMGTVYSGEKIDMWSVGVILYSMITGKSPFQGNDVEELLQNIKTAQWERISEVQGVPMAEECTEVLTKTLRVDYRERPGCEEIKAMRFMQGPKEKLVLAHCEFFISQPKSKQDKFEDVIKSALEDADTNVRDPKTTEHLGMVGEEEVVEATVRTVSDEEDIQDMHPTNMRPVSMTVFHCTHGSHHLVFKVVVTMLSKDGGVTKLYPLVEFDLQSGEAGIFQRVFRKVRGRFGKEMDAQNAGQIGYKAVVADAHLEDEQVPLAAFAAATGLNRAPSYAKLVK